MPVPRAFREHPENAAAIVNAVVVILLPLVLMAGAAQLRSSISNTSTSVSAPHPDGRRSTVIPFLATFVVAMAPAGVLAGWRTRVAALRWIESGTGSWRGVAEAAAGGFLFAALILLPATLVRPTQAPPYILVYGTLAALVGLVFGLVLRTTALLTLRICGAARPT